MGLPEQFLLGVSGDLEKYPIYLSNSAFRVGLADDDLVIRKGHFAT
jgi:hypothetical protein